MLSELSQKILSSTFGKVRFQPIYQKMYSLALRGLNYGTVGSGEEYVMQTIKRQLAATKQPVLFDVGANIGEYTELLLKNFGENARIFSFEPSIATFKTLQKNIKSPKVSLQNKGLGSKNEDIKLFRDHENSTLASAFQRSAEGDFELVQIQRIDTFCQENSILAIDFLKIDVEGFEMEVLAGAEAMLAARKIKFVQFEFGGTQIQPRIFLKDFWDLLSPNYRMYRILNDGLSEIKSYNERIEIFAYSNFLAILK